MARKFIEFLEAAALIILTGVIVVGVIKYIDTKEEPKEETPIVEESVTKTFKLITEDESFEYTYEEGMTWAEWFESDYNTAFYYQDGSDLWITNINDMDYFIDDILLEESVSASIYSLYCNM